MPPVSVTIFASDPGTYFVEDDGIPGNNFSRIRFPNGTVVSFEHPTDDLFFEPSVAGITLVINLTDSLGTARLTAGDLLDPAQSPDVIQVRNLETSAAVILVANNAITESGSDAAPDVIAGTLILSAGTGVGTFANALETQVGTLEAETTTGGMNLLNYGNIVIGGLTDEVVGLDVETSGHLTLTNFGTITVNEESPGGFESIHGGNTSGDVTLTANGFDSDITSIIDQDFIAAPGGNITLTAGRDVSLGTFGANFDNDVRARGNLTINAGRDLNIDGFADLASDGFGAATGGDVIVNAGRDINILNSTGTDGSLGAEGAGGGNTILNAGPGGFVRLLAGSTATLFSSTGDVEVNADRMIISGTSGITAGSGQVSIQPVTEGWNIDLGSATDGAFALELSDAELDRIFTPTLNIGLLTSGTLTVTSALSPAAATNLVLRASTDIYFNASATVAGFMTLQAGDNLFQLAASVITAGGAINAFIDENGDDDDFGGIATLNGTVTATSVTISGNLDGDTMNGSAADETMFGNGGDDTLRGFGGNDELDGGTGSDTTIGGLGDDTHFVDAASDDAVEAVGEGTDLVRSSITYTLVANIENLTLTGSAAINGTGNTLDNVIIGNSAANTLDGKAGVDTLQGLQGDDIYIVQTAGDSVIEVAASGTDLVQSSISFTLGNHVENLTLVNASSINGTGNGLVNIINGNPGNNVLNGAGGADTMTGFAGNDTYFVDNAGDVVTEGGGAGNDTVQSTINFTLGANFENLTLIGTATTGTGNTLDNDITGNGLANTLSGLDGADTLNGGTGADGMIGGSGNDTYIVDNAGDTATEAAAGGIDLVESSVTFTLGAEVENLTLTGTGAINGTGNGLANILTGNSKANILDGAAGADTMIGGDGNDTYVVDNAGDTITEGAGAGSDTVQSSVTFTLVANLEKLTLTGAGAINGTGNTQNNTLNGNGSANILDGAAGADTMIGGGGNDTYIVDNVLETVIEAAAAGTDLVQSSVNFTLDANVENLTLTGAGAIDGTGNTLVNILIGNGAANTLDGLAGADTMAGGGGNDTYVVDNAGDTVSEAAAAGTDLVESSVTFTLVANVENLTLINAGGAINGTGNGLDNVLTGNGSANILNGLAGADAMIGEAGNDTYVVDNAGDTVTETAGSGGVDLVQSSVTFTLGANVENLTLTGGAVIDGTGNSLANTLTGNGNANVLNGLGGADTMIGGAGNDTYVVNNAGDIVTELAAGGTDDVESVISYTLTAEVENLTLTGGSGINGTGNALANIITGNGSTNILDGDAGNDDLFGGGGADTLDGGTNDDDLFGGDGNDDLTGGSGDDKFRFDTALNAATNVDDILDYSVPDDSILLDRDIFTGIAASGTLAAGAFRAGTVAVDADDRILYDSATGQIFYDSDGVGGAAAILFATVTPGTALTNADFNAYI